MAPGIRDPLRIEPLFQFHTLFELLFFKSFMKNAKGEAMFPKLVDKLRAPFYPPGWFPRMPVEPFFHWMTLKDPAYGVPEVRTCFI